MSAPGIEPRAPTSPRWADPLLAVLVLAAFQAEIWLVGDPSLVTPSVVSLAVGMALPLALRGRMPLLSTAVVSAFYIALLRLAFMPANSYLMVVVIILITAYSSGHHPSRTRGVIGGLCILVAAVFELVVDPRRAAPGDYLFITVVVGAAWGAGVAVRQRERRAARLVDETLSLRRQRDAATSQERARIARELHDIISHSVSVMVLQAGAAGEVLDAHPDQAKRSLEAVQQTGRQALVELRRLLGVLGDEASEEPLAPQPGLAQVPALVDSVRSTGLAVDLRVQGAPRPLPPGLDVSAYRIIQEALTNVARHAGPAEVRLVVTHGDDALQIEVLDTGHGPVLPAHSGRGLVGMEQRVALHDGRFEAGPQPDGGFAVRASLPLQPVAP
jgi:signal transduction histidine kinase